MTVSEARVLTIPSGVRFLPTLAESLLSGKIVPGFELGADPLDVELGRLADGLRERPGNARDHRIAVTERDQQRGEHVAVLVDHAANIALHLNRQVKYDNKKNEFIGDEQANRLRSEALREPWRLS